MCVLCCLLNEMDFLSSMHSLYGPCHHSQHQDLSYDGRYAMQKVYLLACFTAT